LIGYGAPFPPDLAIDRGIVSDMHPVCPNLKHPIHWRGLPILIHQHH
jgi:hypothetical protein